MTRNAAKQGLFAELNETLASNGVRGDIYLVGRALVPLVHQTSASTRNRGACFEPAEILSSAAARVAERHVLPRTWLNRAVEEHLCEHGSLRRYLNLSHLMIYTAEPEYLLAMKCLSPDVEDIRFLLRYMNVSDAADAMGIVAEYYPLERLPQATLSLLEDLPGE